MKVLQRAVIAAGLAAAGTLLWRAGSGGDADGTLPAGPPSAPAPLPSLPAPAAAGRPRGSGGGQVIGTPVDCDTEESRHGIKRMYEDTVKALDGCPEARERARRRGQAPP